MKPRERIFAALQRQTTDRTPRFEIWIDALLDELEQHDPMAAYANLGQDCVMLPSQQLPGSNAWRDGVDEWGRVWINGMYSTGVLDTDADLVQYSPPQDAAQLHFDAGIANDVCARYPDHCLIYGTHIGPFMAGYMAMGFDRFFTRLVDDPDFVHRLLQVRTDWCIAQYQRAISLGAEVAVLGDDAAHTRAPMISPRMWRAFVLPYHRQIVDALDVPVIWHSDGNIKPLLPMAIEAGFVGIHGLEPRAGMDLVAIKHEFGRDLVLVGNVDVNILCAPDLRAVRREVDRSLHAGAGPGYMLATCNSVFDGMNPAAVREYFRYVEEVV